jgi:hypothetical protein
MDAIKSKINGGNESRKMTESIRNEVPDEKFLYGYDLLRDMELK